MNVMKKTSFLISIALFMLLAITACITDNDDNLLPINELEIKGIEETYVRVSNAETLEINVDLQASLTGKDTTQFEYLWFISLKTESGGDSLKVIGREKNLKYKVTDAPGTFNVYFRATDKQTGMQWEQLCRLTVVSPFVRGFYLFGDKEDGSCGLDFISMIDEKDTTMIEDIWENKQSLKNAQNIVFTGGADSHNTNLWGVAKGLSFAIEHSATLSSFQTITNTKVEDFIFPTIEVKKPLRVMNVFPHSYGSNNINLSRNSRVLLTEHELFFTQIYGPPEAYGNPINTYSASSSVLFEPAPFAFYQGNSSYPSTMAFYDKTNHRFVRLNGAYYAVSHCAKYNDSEDPFYLDQTKYTPVRNLIYGENGFGNQGRSYALMNDIQGNLFIYCFLVKSYMANGINKLMARTIDKAVATDIDKATHFAFFSMQPVLLYSVGNQLWGYNYVQNKAKMLKQLNAQITYLAMDYHSNEIPTDVIISTYDTKERGTIRKFTLEDDPNDMILTEHSYKTKSYPWKTKLKVVKIEYRNSTL